MKPKPFDFDALGDALRADAQAFIDTYAAQHPAELPIQAFCLYFDSSAGANAMLLPLAAVGKKTKATVGDVASWFRYGPHVEGQPSERTEALLSEYEERFYASEEEGAEAALTAQFQRMIGWVVRHLSFEQLPTADDFVFFAEGMDEEYEQWKGTIPPTLLQKHFGLDSTS